MSRFTNNISQNTLTKSAVFNKLFRLPYFEGWYHKLTCPDAKTFFLVIFGYVSDGKNKFAFIQIASSVDGQQHFFRFPIKDLTITKESVHIGENYFTKNHIYLNLRSCQMDCRLIDDSVNSNINSLIGIKKFVPFVDCKHEVLCFDNMLSGRIVYQQQVFQGAFTYYLETSWGNGFPERYFWLHANCFDNCLNTSFLIALAEPKFLGWKTKQHLGYLRHNGNTHVFRTGNTKVDLNVEKKSLQLQNKNLTVKVQYDYGLPVSLKGPFKGNMENNVVEHIHAKTRLKIQPENGNEIQINTRVATWEIR